MTRPDAIAHSIDAESRIVHVVYGPSYSYEEWEATMRAIFEDAAYRPGFGFLVDRRAASPPQPTVVRRMVGFIGRHRARCEGSRWAFVTSGPADFGMARMAQALAADHPTTLRIFESPATALAWLNTADADLDLDAQSPVDVLVVDDDEADLLRMSALLSAAGHRPHEARDGEEALRLCLERPIRVVVTDLVMPGRDGLTLISNLRSLRPDIPIVAVSGKGRTGLAIAGESGAAVLLEKPVEPAGLVSAIEGALRTRPHPRPDPRGTATDDESTGWRAP